MLDALLLLLLASAQQTSCDEQMDRDADGFSECSDCNDADATIFPGAEDVCDDGLDQNCDGFSSERCPWIDCEAGSDGAEGTLLAPLRTFREALRRVVTCDIDDVHCRPPGIAVHVAPGICPSEGGIHLPIVASVRGSGVEETTLQDDFLLLGDFECADECRYEIRDLTFRGLQARGTDALAHLTDVRTVASSEVHGYWNAPDAVFSFQRADLFDLTASQRATVDLRDSIVRGPLTIASLEEGGNGFIYNSSLTRLSVGDNASVTVERCTFQASGGVAASHTQHSYGGELVVKDSLFEGYATHLIEDCSPGNLGAGGCAAELSRNTFVGSSGPSIVVRPVLSSDSPLEIDVSGNVFYRIGADTVEVESGGSVPALSMRVAFNNFDPRRAHRSRGRCALSLLGRCFPRGEDINASELGTGNLDVTSGFRRTGDYHLAPHSRLIDRGDPLIPDAPCPWCPCPGRRCPLIFDRDGSSRPVDGDEDGTATLDIGSFEYQPRPR